MLHPNPTVHFWPWNTCVLYTRVFLLFVTRWRIWTQGQNNASRRSPERTGKSWKDRKVLIAVSLVKLSSPSLREFSFTPRSHFPGWLLFEGNLNDVQPVGEREKGDRRQTVQHQGFGTTSRAKSQHVVDTIEIPSMLAVTRELITRTSWTHKHVRIPFQQYWRNWSRFVAMALISQHNSYQMLNLLVLWMYFSKLSTKWEDLFFRVHEYGGGAFCVFNSTLYFTNFSDQCLYAQKSAAEAPELLSPTNTNCRLADSELHPKVGEGFLKGEKCMKEWDALVSCWLGCWVNKKQCSRQLQCEVPCSVGSVMNSSLFINSSLSSLSSTSHAVLVGGVCLCWGVLPLVGVQQGEGGLVGEGGPVGGGGSGRGRGRRQGHFRPAAIYCTTTWCFDQKGLGTIEICVQGEITHRLQKQRIGTCSCDPGT